MGRGTQKFRRPSKAATFDLIERSPPLLVAACAALFHMLLYGFANRFPSSPASLLPETWLDRAMPLWPWTSWIYVSCHALVLAAFWPSRAPGARARFAAVFAVVIALSVAIHWALPVRFPRESFPLPEEETPGVALLRWLRGVDRPTSAFPSLHVAMAAAAALQATRQRLRATPAIGLWALAVALSTLTTKQHYAVDVAAGVALALAVDWAVHLVAAHPGRRAFA